MALRGRSSRFVSPPTDTHRINQYIRAAEVRLVGPDGKQLGVVPIQEALRRAEEAHLDLVEIAPNAQPPVCRIMDYGKFKYQQHKKEAEARRKQSVTTVKELRLGYRTDVGDLERQIQRAREFLQAGDRVKFTLRFRGREMAYQDLGREKLMKVCEALADISSVEGTPRMDGRIMSVVLAPGAKKKGKAGAAASERESGTTPSTPPSSPTGGGETKAAGGG